ncbi:MAG TPA: FecR domain-containing protein [Chryseolinea sp.]
MRDGSATPEERELLESRWEEATSDQSGLEDFSTGQRKALKTEMYRAITERLEFGRHRRLMPANLLYKIAASITLLCAITYFFYSRYATVDTHIIAENNFIDVQTKFGEQLSVKLPDESSVVLNGNSTLRYAKTWSSTSPREVWITGEGFFAVQHTKNHQKFIVHTQEGLNVEVLGTKFNVKSRGRGSEVLLTEGSVKLNLASESKNEVILQPGEMATMKEKKLQKKSVEGKKYTSWVTRKLFFDKMPLSELAEMLNDTYGMQVNFQNEDLKSRQLSGEISSASIDDILFAIAETFDVEVTRQGDKSVIFSSKSK